MTDGEYQRVHAILLEHFQSFALVGFDLEGRKWRMADHQTDLQAHGLANAMREELNQNLQAPEVWVRNLSPGDEP